MKLFKRQLPDVKRHPRPTGSASVFSYYASRSRIDQKTGRKEQTSNDKSHVSWFGRHISWQGLPVLVALVAITVSLAYVLIVDVNPRVEIISKERILPLVQEKSVYEEAGKEILERSALNRFKLTVDTPSIARELRAMFPELSEVVITIPVASRRLVFEMQAATPFMVMRTSGQSVAYIIDEEGRAVIETQEVVGLSESDLPVVQDESGLELVPGKVALPKENVRFISEIALQLAATGTAIKQLVMPRIANEVHVYPEGMQYYVKFNMAGDARVQAGMFSAVKKRLLAEGRVPSEYIDVRTEEKAYYK